MVMEDRQKKISDHLIELGRIADLTALLKIAATYSPYEKDANFVEQLADAFSLLHSWMQHHISELNELTSN